MDVTHQLYQILKKWLSRRKSDERDSKDAIAPAFQGELEGVFADLVETERSFLRSFASAGVSADIRTYVVNALDCLMLNHGAKEIDETGVAFDAALHRIDYDITAPQDGAIVDTILSPGLRIGDRVLKKAKVSVKQEG